MRRLLVLGLVALASNAKAQSDTTSSSSKAPAKAATPAVTSAPAESVKAADKEQLRKEISEELRKEMEGRLEKAKDEMREEMRGALATQSANKAWDTEWQEEQRKLELVEINGYLRLRPNLLNNYSLGRGPDPWGYTTFPVPFQSSRKTQAGADMRFRFEPTINVSEDIRIRAQIDLLDNLVLGTTPLGAHIPSDASPIAFFSNTQVPPIQGVNSVTNAVNVKRLYAEVNTQVGLLRFGRMGSHWGMGILTNDGDCFDCDYGDTVDRVMFVLKLADWFIVPMFDFVSVGPTTAGYGAAPYGEIYPQDNGSNTLSFNLAIARRDTEKEIQKKIDAGQSIFNYGAYVTYRTQSFDAAGFNSCSPTNNTINSGNNFNPNCQAPYGNLTGNQAGWILRNAWAVTPDLWVKYRDKDLRIEAEGAMVIGRLGTYDADASGNPIPATQPQSISMLQWGAAAQGEYKLLDGLLSIQVELGAASGSKSWGMGSLPGRISRSSTVTTPVPGMINGPSYYCTTTTCPEGNMNGFLFNRDYRIDTILWRDLYQGVTNAMYAKPTIRYEVTTGLSLFVSGVYSRAMFVEGTPSAACGTATGLSGYDPSTGKCVAGQSLVGDANLGVELNGGANYVSDDGFVLGITYAVLFPLGGLNNNYTNPTQGASTAQAVRGMIGVKF